MKMNHTTTQILSRLETHGVVALRGANALIATREAIEYAVRAAGFTIAFDPASEPDMIDYLTVTVVSGVEGAALGASVGGLIGLLLGTVGSGVVIGAGLGALAGVARGVNRVERGWRVRAVWDETGAANVTIHVLDAS